MNIAIEVFREARGRRLVLSKEADWARSGVERADLSLASRLRSFSNDKGGSFWFGTADHQSENRAIKAAFYAALVKAEGKDIADKACRAAGLPSHDVWKSTPTPLSARQVARVLGKAQKIRERAVTETLAHFTNYVSGADRRRFFSQKYVNKGPSLSAAYQDVAREKSYLDTKIGEDQHADLCAMVFKGVLASASYGKKSLDFRDIDGIARETIRAYLESRENGFVEQHPALARHVRSLGEGQSALIPMDLKSIKDGLPRRLENDFFRRLESEKSGLSNEDVVKRKEGFDVFLGHVKSCLEMLNKSDNALKEWKFDGNLFSNCIGMRSEVSQWGDVLEAFANSQETSLSDSERKLLGALIQDLRRQDALLKSKSGVINDINKNNPMSMKSVAHSNLLWAQAAGFILEDAGQQLSNQGGIKGSLNGDGRNQPEINILMSAKVNLLERYERKYEHTPPSLIAPTGGSSNPVVQGRKSIESELRQALTRAGFSDRQIGALMSEDGLKAAHARALREYDGWMPVERDMVVSRGGKTRTYRSVILPGSSISKRFARGLHTSGSRGTPSSVKDSGEHARNLKVSKLQRPAASNASSGTSEITMATVVGHGVLDMWDIADPEKRQQANERGAHQVLEAAIVSNDRIRNEALLRAEGRKDARPVKITHVSVNLTTPSPWRELPVLRNLGALKDYQELTYTREQFRAFEANSSAAHEGQPIEFRIDDDRQGASPREDVSVKVQVETINFSFGINPMATHVKGAEGARLGALAGAMTGLVAGSVVPVAGNVAGAVGGAVFGAVAGGLGLRVGEDLVGGWDLMYDHNRREMIKFVGDLGSGKTGADGAHPGGFIGTVYDRLDPNEPSQKAMMARILAQTNLVRRMFTHEDYRRGNGDPAKMGREVLALQVYAEQALEMLGVADEAATMSKGCKSDKDRGGVTDVELKHKLLTEDMGGAFLPDQKLTAEDQANYYVVAMASGQFENQQLNTGLPGSKEAGKLRERIPDPWVRTYLRGLSAFAPE